LPDLTAATPAENAATQSVFPSATRTASGPESKPAPDRDDSETALESLSSICTVLAVGLFVMTFIFQNFEIPSASMENTLLIGDHVLVDRITLAPPSHWFPLMHYREPRRGDVIVFLKPHPETPDLYLVKRCIGLPGDHIHLAGGVVYLNGVAQSAPKDGSDDPGAAIDQIFLDEFPSIPPAQAPSGAETPSWADDAPNHIVDGDLVVPPNMFFMMGDNRHNSLDSRYWGFVPMKNIRGKAVVIWLSAWIGWQTKEFTFRPSRIGTVLH